MKCKKTECEYWYKDEGGEVAYCHFNDWLALFVDCRYHPFYMKEDFKEKEMEEVE